MQVYAKQENHELTVHCGHGVLAEIAVWRKVHAQDRWQQLEISVALQVGHAAMALGDLASARTAYTAILPASAAAHAGKASQAFFLLLFAC